MIAVILGLLVAAIISAGSLAFTDPALREAGVMLGGGIALVVLVSVWRNEEHGR